MQKLKSYERIEKPMLRAALEVAIVFYANYCFSFI
jgi:hypothetical protein